MDELMNHSVASTPSTLTDVTQSDSLTAAFEHCVVVYGRPPDVVYANAGVGIPDTLALDQEVGEYPVFLLHALKAMSELTISYSSHIDVQSVSTSS